jgi:glutamyl-tRNA synthetase
VKEGKAYYCFCSQKRLDEVRKKMVKAGKPPMYDGYCRRLDPVIAAKRAKVGGQYVIRLKVPQEETIVVNDLLRGEVKFASLTVDDQVLLKSDGLPTYHLAVVVDDHLMEISHMVRGEEWLSSGPKQVLLYDFFGWEKPVFIHTPIIRNPDKSKLSKRQGHASVSWYQENGYLAEAILNFLALLGWSHPREKTIFSLKEFIKFFELKDLSVVGPIVDLKKLDYLNGVYLRQTKDKRLVQLIKPYLKFKLSEEVLEKIIPLIKERMVKLTDVNELVDFLVKEIKYKPSLLFYKTKDKNLIKKQLSLLLSALERIDWRVKKITQALQEICQTHGWSKGQFFMALRVAVTGKTVTPPLFESLEILGKSETLKRIEKALSLL